MLTRKDGIIHSRLSFSVLEDKIILFNDGEEVFACYDKFAKRLTELLEIEIKKVVEALPNMTNARIEIVLTYMTNPGSLNYPFEVRVIKK